jgi:hypothetical protein
MSDVEGSTLTVWTGDHDHEAIRIAEPDLPVLRRRVYKRSFDHLSHQLTSAFYGGVKVLHLEPQDDAMPDRCRSGIDEVGVIFCIPGV